MQDKKENSLLRKQELFFIQLPIYSPDLKMVLIFLVMKVFQKGTGVQCSDKFMFNSLTRCYVTQWSCSDNVVASTVCTDTLPGKNKLHTKLEVM